MPLDLGSQSGTSQKTWALNCGNPSALQGRSCSETLGSETLGLMEAQLKAECLWGAQGELQGTPRD